VHERLEGHNRVKPPIDYKCIGFECKNKDFCCVAKCPRQALSLSLNPMYETLGDFRWTADMITGTWIMAETGYPAGTERSRIQYRELGRRLRQAAAQIPGQTGQGRRGGDFDGNPAEPEKRRTGQCGHFDPGLWRRHVLWLGQPPHDGFQGAERIHLEHIQLHGRRRLPRDAQAVR
jgi:hypothetical protein